MPENVASDVGVCSMNEPVFLQVHGAGLQVYAAHIPLGISRRDVL